MATWWIAAPAEGRTVTGKGRAADATAESRWFEWRRSVLPGPQPAVAAMGDAARTTATIRSAVASVLTTEVSIVN